MLTRKTLKQWQEIKTQPPKKVTYFMPVTGQKNRGFVELAKRISRLQGYCFA